MRIYARRSAHAEHVQLRLVETHVAQRQTGKQTRQEDEDRDETREDNELDAVVRVVNVTARERVHAAATTGRG